MQTVEYILNHQDLGIIAHEIERLLRQGVPTKAAIMRIVGHYSLNRHQTAEVLTLVNLELGPEYGVESQCI